MNNCKDCAKWKSEPGDSYPKKIKIGKCNNAPMFWGSTEWTQCNCNGGIGCSCDIQMVVRPEIESLAFVQDGSDYYAELLTLENFGCIQWKAKE